MMKKYLVTILFLVASVGVFGQSIWEGYEHLFTPARHYVVYKAKSPIKIDGKADERSWEKAEWSADFADIEGDKKPLPLHETRLKMLWDENYLYIFVELEEPHVWAYYNERDLIVYHENDFEVFIDPDGNAHDYFEFEVNAANTLFDLFMPKSYRNGGRPFVIYDALGFESQVSIEGTLNKPDDVDQKWSVEMKIPFADLRTGVTTDVPTEGEQWRINFSRVQWQTKLVDGKYTRLVDESTGRLVPEYNWVWSPQGIISMHAPERYGFIQFTEKAVGSRKVDFLPEVDQLLVDYTWLIYYKQKTYKQKHGCYASSPEELGLKAELTDGKNGTAKVEVWSTVHQFSAKVTGSKGQSFFVNDNGLFQRKNP